MSFGISASCLATGEHVQSHKPCIYTELPAPAAVTTAALNKRKIASTNKVLKKTPNMAPAA